MLRKIYLLKLKLNNFCFDTRLLKSLHYWLNLLLITKQFYLFANERLTLQDGQIDYGEFAAMMRKGNGGVGRRTMRGNFNLGEALGVAAQNDKCV